MSKFKVIQLLPELNIGGVERGTKDFSKVLVERGHDSLVISNGGIFEKDIIEDGGKHINLPIHKKSLFSIRYVSDLRDIYLSEKYDFLASSHKFSICSKLASSSRQFWLFNRFSI